MDKSKKDHKSRDVFEEVAKRLGCDLNLKEFDKKLGKIARSNPKAEKGK
jgi:hypothetical protein